MEIKTFVFNHFGQNTYMIIDDVEKKCAVVDPGCFFDNEKEELKAYIIDNGLTLEKIIFTHCHLDHAFGAAFLYKEFPVSEIVGHKEEKLFIDDAINQSLRFGIRMEQPPSITNYITEGAIIKVGSIPFFAIHVPGHSKGSLCYYNADNKVIIVGDVLFSGSVGRSDLVGGDHNTLINGIKSKLMVLPEDTVVYSGHGPSTTIGTEKFSNSYLL